ncbi:MAG: TRAM domain-containing protein, partial [Ktedonobacteraceae bacterium]
DIPLPEKKRRLHAVEDVQAKIALAINQQYLGNIEEVLVEEENSTHGRQQWKGRNRTNKLVFFPQPEAECDIRPGDLAKVEIERTTAWSLQGCMVAV